MSVIRHISDRIMVMYLGQVMEMAEKKDLFEDTRHPYTIALMSAIPVPDPAKQKERILLEGDIPSPLNAPVGCPFVTRCSHAMPKCKNKKAMLHEVTPGHYVACHLFDKEGELK